MKILIEEVQMSGEIKKDKVNRGRHRILASFQESKQVRPQQDVVDPIVFRWRCPVRLSSASLVTPNVSFVSELSFGDPRVHPVHSTSPTSPLSPDSEDPVSKATFRIRSDSTFQRLRDDTRTRSISRVSTRTWT